MADAFLASYGRDFSVSIFHLRFRDQTRRSFNAFNRCSKVGNQDGITLFPTFFIILSHFQDQFISDSVLYAVFWPFGVRPTGWAT